jgi:3-methyladenine DNA glycosylase AlkD
MILQTEFRKCGNTEYANHSQRYFKTGAGEYGYGDIFLGIRMPMIRQFAKENSDIPLADIKKLIRSEFHEERLLGLLILVYKYDKSKSEREKKKYYQIYIKSFKNINNWDLVDVTCPHIVGQHLFDKDRSILYEWANSNNLWTRRISIVTNLWFIRKGQWGDVFDISKILLNDEHDLIHKAVGWMLREAGKKDMNKTETFMKKYYSKMPRTMLRYAIERYPEAKRQKYLKGKV